MNFISIERFFNAMIPRHFDRSGQGAAVLLGYTRWLDDPEGG
jgi:hypothetical protein